MLCFSSLSHHFFLSHHQKESFSRITLQKSSFLSSFFPMKLLLSLLSSSLILFFSFSTSIFFSDHWFASFAPSLHSTRYPLIKYREIASTKPSSLSLSLSLLFSLTVFHSPPSVSSSSIPSQFPDLLAMVEVRLVCE